MNKEFEKDKHPHIPGRGNNGTWSPGGDSSVFECGDRAKHDRWPGPATRKMAL